MPDPGTASVEQEVKFHLPDPAAFRARLVNSGAKPFQPRILETNIRLDASDGRLTRQGMVLRLRRAGKCILTFKQPESQTGAFPHSAARRSLETEILVDSLEKAEHILAGLGFRAVVRYEKYREVFRQKSVLIMLDELPYGSFVELEGLVLEDLRRTAAVLGLEWNRALQTSYMAIFLALKRHHKLGFLDATFDHFRGWDAARTTAILAALPQEALHDRKAL